MPDVMRHSFVMLLMIGVGVALGFRLGGSVLAGVTAVGLVAAFGFAFSWIMASVGLAVKNPEAAQAAGFLVAFPLTFASSVFVPAQTMPAWLQHFTQHQPVTATVDAVRGLIQGTSSTSEIVVAIAWTIGILMVFVPIAVALYRRSAQ